MKKKKLDGNYTRILRAILNKSWRQHPTRHQLYGHLPPITKTIQVTRTRHAGEARTNSSVMYSYGPPPMAKQKQDDQLEHTYSSYVRIRDVTLKTCQKRWMIGRSGERGSGISVLAVRHDDDDDEEFILTTIPANTNNLTTLLYDHRLNHKRIFFIVYIHIRGAYDKFPDWTHGVTVIGVGSLSFSGDNHLEVAGSILTAGE